LHRIVGFEAPDRTQRAVDECEGHLAIVFFVVVSAALAVQGESSCAPASMRPGVITSILACAPS
jgi:hypothetical protein